VVQKTEGSTWLQGQKQGEWGKKKKLQKPQTGNGNRFRNHAVKKKKKKGQNNRTDGKKNFCAKKAK